MKRKNFIQTSGAALLGSLLLRNKALASLAYPPKDLMVGLQLFTFFNVIDDECAGHSEKNCRGWV